ncbi:Arginase family protein [Aspergillus parasiticus SU-1]|uniref:agmatinase n=5 Tax=Aspergillus subgen. Circumdati TaxID=2720871 RepID=A0A5N6DHM5_ASPPA|nr:arginase family protein [Aspergillus parasiticus]KAB8218499.1 arginase family protein [Aspergillus novoparasiticus]KAE8309290.1 arginase family protein [Aspergillus transmontanensis]KAE8325244.1 arginase family protein [Aspergillus sergii]KJK63480.1 Arginase family protein [Aspergillus parasiticus SU-1]
MKYTLGLLALAGTALSHAHHDDTEVVPEHLREELLKKWDQEWTFSGIASFAHLKPVKCLIEPDERYDIAVIGAPFDTAVSYRPGARFGPRAIRAASARQMAGTAYNTRAGINPYSSWATVKDCGDIPIIPFDNGVAERQMYEAFLELGSRSPITPADSKYGTKGISAGKAKLVTLGGDHSVALPALRALYQIYQKPITVLHFDAHLDTWNPVRYSAYWTSEQSAFNHGSFFHKASREGLICNSTSAHAGLRTRLTGVTDSDYTNPGPEQGFMRIHADDIDDLGPMGIVDKIIERIGLDSEQPVYLSVDIDVLDPATAPGTGTPEPGGWTTREFIRIMRGIEKLNIVGADIVEVSPSYDNKGETTALAAAQVAFEIITSMVKAGAGEDLGGWYGRKEEKIDASAKEGEAKKEGKDEL